MEVVVNYGQVKWDTKKEVFYLLKDYRKLEDDRDFYNWTDFTSMNNGAQNNIKTYFNWSNKTDCYSLFYFYRMTNCQYFTNGYHDIDKDESNRGSECGFISPLTEHLFMAKGANYNEPQSFFKFLYEKYRKDDSVTHIRDTIYNKCMDDLKFFAAFIKLVGHLQANSYDIYGMGLVEAQINNMKLSTLKIAPKFHTERADYKKVQLDLDTDPQKPGTKANVNLLDSNNGIAHTTTIDIINTT